MSYSFVDKSADEILRDLEANAPQSEIGGGAFDTLLRRSRQPSPGRTAISRSS